MIILDEYTIQSVVILLLFDNNHESSVLFYGFVCSKLSFECKFYTNLATISFSNAYSNAGKRPNLISKTDNYFTVLLILIVFLYSDGIDFFHQYSRPMGNRYSLNLES